MNEIDRLKQIALFSEFAGDSSKIEKIASMMKKKQVRAGEIIIREGDEGDTLFIILNGSVRIQKTTLQNEPYTVVILKESHNVYFGELALIDNDRRSATVVAESDCELLSLSRKDFSTLCEEDFELGFRVVMQIARKLSGSLRKMNQDVITLFEALVAEVEGEELI
jgi:CRP/FNR family transcriptional regulator, cyclic AMP receptor protein